MATRDSPQEKLAVYLIDKEGRYDDPQWMTAVEVPDFVRRECRNYHEIRVVDRGDCLCMHVVEGEVLYPDKAAMVEYWQKQMHRDN